VSRTLLLLSALLLPLVTLAPPAHAQRCGLVQIGLYSEQSGGPVSEGELVDVQVQIYSYSGMPLNGCSVSWRVSGPGTLIADDSYGARVRVGPGPGTLNVSVRPRGSTQSASLRFAVTEVPMLLELRPDTVALAVGAEQRPNLTLTTARGDTYPLHSARWESDNPAVATVDSTGVVRGVTRGTATVKATIELSGGARERSVTTTVKVE
jgi:hypothetical protein